MFKRKPDVPFELSDLLQAYKEARDGITRHAFTLEGARLLFPQAEQTLIKANKAYAELEEAYDELQAIAEQAQIYDVHGYESLNADYEGRE